MTELLSELITPEIKMALEIVLIVIAFFYLLSIIWVISDSYLRGSSPIRWGIVALVPFLGCMIYAMMRPPLYASDREEQNVGILLQQRQLMDYGECPQCGYPTTSEYVVCPNCQANLRSLCSNCGRTHEPEWMDSPYCATTIRKKKGDAASGRALPKAGESYQAIEDEDIPLA